MKPAKPSFDVLDLSPGAMKAVWRLAMGPNGRARDVAWRLINLWSHRLIQSASVGLQLGAEAQERPSAKTSQGDVEGPSTGDPSGLTRARVRKPIGKEAK